MALAQPAVDVLLKPGFPFVTKLNCAKFICKKFCCLKYLLYFCPRNQEVMIEENLLDGAYAKGDILEVEIKKGAIAIERRSETDSQT